MLSKSIYSPQSTQTTFETGGGNYQEFFLSVISLSNISLVSVFGDYYPDTLNSYKTCIHSNACSRFDIIEPLDKDVTKF